MKTTQNQKLSFWQWLNKYRSKIGLLAFVIAIPLTLLLIAFLGPYFTNKSVHFDQEKTDIQRRFQAVDELDELLINIEWATLKNPEYDDETDELMTHGLYGFKINYEAKGSYDISNVSVTPVLHTDWFPYYAIGSKTAIYETNRTISIVWDERFPMRRLGIITVNEPNLYLKVEYSYINIEQTINEVAYVMYSLNDINPTTVN